MKGWIPWLVLWCVFSLTAVFGQSALDFPCSPGLLNKDSDDKTAETITYFGYGYTSQAFVFVLDYSESMNLRGKIDMLRRETARAIGEMSDRSEFNIILFNVKEYSLYKMTMTAAGGRKRQAKEFLCKHPEFTTRVSRAVIMALDQLNRSAKEEKRVILVCDGNPTAEKIVFSLRDIACANRSMIPIDTLYIVGEGKPDTVNQARQYMRTVSAASHGVFREVAK